LREGGGGHGEDGRPGKERSKEKEGHAHDLLKLAACRKEQAAQKGPDARRRPKAAGEAYSLYVEPAAEGANEADGPFQPPAFT
jgi:hypothetical protein